MTKLSEEIRAGINESVIGITFEAVKYALYGVLLVIFIFLVYVDMKSNYIDSPVIDASIPLSCDKPYITCGIKDSSIMLENDDACSINATDEYGNTVCSVPAIYHPVIAREKLCGWEEAIFWLEYYKSLGNYNIKMECES